jgi:cytidylate kinase
MICIGLEGQAKTGKSTLANLFAQHDNFVIFESGSIYRILALHFIKQNLPNNIIEEELNLSLEDIINKYNISYDFTNYCFKFSYDDDLQSKDISELAAKIGSITKTKYYGYLASIIKTIISSKNVIFVGRNVVTIYPDLDFHFYLLASDEQRASFSKDSLIKRDEYEKIISKYYSKCNDHSKCSTICIKVMDSAKQTYDQIMSYIEKRNILI